MLVCLSVNLSPQILTPSFHLVDGIQLQELFLELKDEVNGQCGGGGAYNKF